MRIFASILTSYRLNVSARQLFNYTNENAKLKRYFTNIDFKLHAEIYNTDEIIEI